MLANELGKHWIDLRVTVDHIIHIYVFIFAGKKVHNWWSSTDNYMTDIFNF